MDIRAQCGVSHCAARDEFPMLVTIGDAAAASRDASGQLSPTPAQSAARRCESI